jgi:hypothetical protein
MCRGGLATNFELECEDLFHTTKTNIKVVTQLVAHELDTF